MSIPAVYRGLVDDAAIFPPAEVPLPRAVADHAAHLRSEHRDLLGPFLVDAGSLDRLCTLVAHDEFPGGLRVSVVVPAPDVVARVVAAVGRCSGLLLAAVEVKLDPSRPAADQVHQLAADPARLGVRTYVEVARPGDPEWSQVADEVAAGGLLLKFRTGGEEASAFPSEAEVAAWIRDAAARRTAFKCTAGLHNAVRHTSATTGFEHHGYLNVLLATERAAQGRDVHAVAAALAERDPRVLTDELTANSGQRLLDARKAFTSYGSCSILEPLHDLTALGLLDVTSGP